MFKRSAGWNTEKKQGLYLDKTHGEKRRESGWRRASGAPQLNCPHEQRLSDWSEVRRSLMIRTKPSDYSVPVALSESGHRRICSKTHSKAQPLAFAEWSVKF
jgi:hypothetical protein